MAIIQISKIQQRSGNLVDLPQLDEAQFGWASDAKRLFIGKTSPNENIEVLTSYSNISFSQIDGSGGANFNVATPTNGQVLTYVTSTNTWDNWPSADILSANSSFKLNLGDAGNIKMTGGSTGFVLQTDGLGNLSWTPKTTIVANITGLTNNPTGNIITMTVANTTPYTNGTEITISGVNGVSNSNVNSTNFYVKLASNFPTTGNVTLYTDSGLTVTANGVGLTYTNSPNALAITTVGGTSTLVAAGANTNMQFNNGGTLTGSPYLTILNGNGLLTHTGPYFSVGNVYANSGAVVGSTLTGTLTTNAQPNITSTGTLASLSVTANANIGNIGTAGLITATGNIRGGNLVTPGVLSSTGNANVGNLGTAGLITATGNIGGGNINTGGVVSATGNANVGNVNTTGVFATTLSASGNANVGNLGTAGLITATGNLNAGNIITGGVVSATGNITGGNIAGGNLVTANYFTGTLTTGAQPNITSTGTLANLSVTGNANIGNIGTATAIITTGNISTINSGLLQNGNSNITITANGNVSITAAGATTELIVTSTGANIAGTLSVSGNANVGNLGTAGLITVTGNIGGGNIVTGGVVTATGNITGGNLTTGGLITATGNITGGNVSGTLLTGTLATASQPNVTSVSTSFTNLTFANAQTISGNNITLTTGANTNAGTITGNWSLSTGSKLQATYADLAEYYEADAHYEPGTVLAFGGEKEVTIAEDGTTRVAGVVSTNPAYAMNAKCPGIAVEIALQGRVPTKVRGTIRKGDLMVSAGNGYARPWNNPQMGTVIGKALENFDGVEGVIEVAVGRL